MPSIICFLPDDIIRVTQEFATPSRNIVINKELGLFLLCGYAENGTAIQYCGLFFIWIQ
jgi:hypothetical protein